ncbi:hypothetical protein DE146DRAFT_435409 [Phaeosphaeria sp. MPI-PUGE-AT-0046c]|nr:hypothetical protein DE146DRAFT_435409 [Phaeosphaeria sp. MPI-PUGE-AT-0046c]
MSELKPAFKPYNLETSLFDDCGDDCIVIDVGGGEYAPNTPSLKRVADKVDGYLRNIDAPAFAAKKLYITGQWIASPLDMESVGEPEAIETKECARKVAEWKEATEKIGSLIEQMGNLEELTWFSGLPFTAAVLEKLSNSMLKKLVVDLGEPVRLDENGDIIHESYITFNELRPLQEQVKLKELRLFRVHDSIQAIVWETIFRNTSDGGMRILELQMAKAPIVRSEQWKKAKDVTGLTVPTEEATEQGYKGKDGKGVLHYTIGTGEYLDDYCIRKARIASGLDEAIPLPLWGLKLDGFVIDSLPFQHELSDIVLLICGENCVDAGLRAPKTARTPRNKWSRAVNNATSHCLIQWPHWAGIFDNRGDQRDQLGVVVSQESAFSTSLTDIVLSPIMPLTEEALNLKDLDNALADTNKSSSAMQLPTAHMSLETVSNKSERGSEVPTPANVSSAAILSPLVTAYDNPPTTLSASQSDLSVVMVDGAEDSLSPTSTLSSFEHVSPPAIYTAGDASTEGSAMLTAEVDKTVKKSTLAHKVRRSFDWLTGSSSS